MERFISFEFAVYYLPEPTKNPLEHLDQLLRDSIQSIRRVSSIDEKPISPVVSAKLELDPNNTYPPPDLQYLQYFGRGLNHDQAEALQKTKAVLILRFAHSRDHVWEGMKAALQLTHRLAQDTGGLIWDEATREIFTMEAWDGHRLRDWNETIPDISKHIVIHEYRQEGRLTRAITLGMAKMGLPDVLVDDFSWSLSRNMGHVINLFGQAIAEGAAIEKAGEFDLNINTIKHTTVKEQQVNSFKSNAIGLAKLTLTLGKREEGDPENRLIEIRFDRGRGSDHYAQQQQVISEAFGWEDTISPVEHDEELLSASRRARTKLPDLRAAFKQGLAPGEIVQVKAPFATPDEGQEWMWVEVTSWDGNRIKGLLNNEPFNIPNLHAGQMVEISETDVFDYIRRHANGNVEGNETGKLIEKLAP